MKNETDTYIHGTSGDSFTQSAADTDIGSNSDHIPSRIGTFSSSLQIPSANATAPLPSDALLIPVEFFRLGMSGLEAITFYLHTQRGMRFCEIAKATKRDDRTIWDSFARAQEKFSLDSKEPLRFVGITIPLGVFEERTLGVLEAACAYLREVNGLRLSQIAQLLGKNDRTIWTAYDRAKKKRAKHAQ